MTYQQRTTNNRTMAVDDTRFIYATNFSGNPENDRYSDGRRKANLIIREPDQVQTLIDWGVKVRQTNPRDGDGDDFEPECFATVILQYHKRNGEPVKYPPKVYLVSGDSEPVPLDEESVACLDHMRIRNVNAIITPYVYDEANNGASLYVRTMYVEQDTDDDPYAARYARKSEEDDLPF